MLNIGTVYRADYSHDPKDHTKDGMPNYYFETYIPRKKRQVIFERGIYNVEGITGTDGINRIPLIIISSSPHKAGSSWTPWSDTYDPDHGVVIYYNYDKWSHDCENYKQ